MYLPPVMEKKDRAAILAQVLEDATGCRAAVASMLLLDLPADVVNELVVCDQELTRLISVTLRRLGLSANLN
jgi:hypothetical protein